MAEVKKIIMAWSECDIAITPSQDDGSFPTTELTSIGPIKDKSSRLEPSEGDKLEMKKTGGKVVASEAQEGGFVLKTRVIEPTDDLLAQLGLGAAAASGDFNVKTHLVDGNYAVKLTPKKVGAVGIKAPVTEVKYMPGWSEEDGNYADLEFNIIHGPANYWYSRFKKTASTQTTSTTEE